MPNLPMLRRRSNSTSKRPITKTVFKKFLEFLQSAIWQLPTSMFMEQNSVVFDHDQLDPALFKKIHSYFVFMIDNLINAYCADTKITPEELVAALKLIDLTKQLSWKKRILLEPVVAAQDFHVFVVMMMRKNVELQLQALKLMQHVSGIVPTAMTFKDEDAILWEMLKDEEECERVVLISVIRKSREDNVNNGYINLIQPGEEQHVSDEELILKSIQEQQYLGLDEAICQNLKNGLETLILKKPKTPSLKTVTTSSTLFTTNLSQVDPKSVNTTEASTAEKLTLQNFKVGTEDASIPPNTNDIDSADKIVPAMTQVASRPSSKRSKSSSHLLTSKTKNKDDQKAVLEENKTFKDKKKSSMNKSSTPLASDTIKTAIEKIPSRSGTASRQEQKPPTTVLIPGMSDVDNKHAPFFELLKANDNKMKPDSPNKAMINHMFDYRTLLKKREQISEEDIKRRETYLRQQRDKLLRLKQEEQQKQLQVQTTKVAKERPKTAQAARNAMTPSRMENRKAVALKLRDKVIDPVDEHTTSTSTAKEKQSS